jgi:hypothetical protein
MSETLYLRPSGINCFLECSAKYYFQNVEKIQTPNKLALAFGTSIHRTLQENFSQKITTREDIPLEQAKDIFSSVADEEFSQVDPMDFTEEKPGHVKDTGIELIEKYQKEHAYRIFPKRVEQKIEVKFKNYDYGLCGTIDLIDEDNVLIDHKTSSKDLKEIPESYKLQVGGAYPLLVKSLSASDSTIEPVKSARIDYLIRRSAKSSGTQIKPLEIQIDKQYFLNMFQTVGNAIQRGIFFPNRQHMFCTKRFCKYWKECEDKYKGRVRE